jgi:hypothetical protein
MIASMSTLGMDHQTLITAVVHAPDGVRFVAAGESADQVTAALVGYVRRRCDDVLWPSAARHVRALLQARESQAAVTAYFEHVGSRWDEERLEIHITPPIAAEGSPSRAPILSHPSAG